MSVRIHDTALVEDGVNLGAGTSVWDNAHLRAPSRIGSDCIIGGKSYIAYGVEIGDRVKINAFVYICYGVTIETGVFIGAGTVFTNDRFPRACDPDLKQLQTSAPTEETLDTCVRKGATIGARALIDACIAAALAAGRTTPERPVSRHKTAHSPIAVSKIE